MKTLKTAALVTVAALTLGASATQASQVPADGPDAEQVKKARGLVIQARQLSENFQEYGTASKLYRRAAQLYEEAEAAADAWSMAGILAFYSGDNRASSDLARAGEVALAYGRVSFAAKAFLDGAWVAQREGKMRTALDLATRGDRLAESPLLAASERRALKERIAQRGLEIDGVEG